MAYGEAYFLIRKVGLCEFGAFINPAAIAHLLTG